MVSSSSAIDSGRRLRRLGRDERRVLLRRERIQSVGLSRLRERPHSGPLLYEQLFGLEYDRFRSAAAGFVAEHLSPEGPPAPYGE